MHTIIDYGLNYNRYLEKKKQSASMKQTVFNSIDSVICL